MDNQKNTTLAILLQSKKTFWSISIAGSLAGVLLAVVMPNIYQSTARIYFPDKGNASSMIMAQMGALASPAGGLFGLRSQNDLYVGMLQSDSISDKVIEKNALKSRFDVETQVDARKRLADIVEINSGKDGIINISFEDVDPKVAAKVVSTYVSELDRMTRSFTMTEASQQRVFYEEQMKMVSARLADAENALKELQQKKGVIALDGQATAAIEAIARLEAQIAERRVYLSRISSYATSSNPDVKNVNSEIKQLENELITYKEKAGAPGDLLLGSKSLPENGLAYVRKLRDVKFAESLLGVMERQYEVMRLSEAQDSSAMRVVDAPTVSDKKAKPARAFIVVFISLMSFVLAAVFVLLAEKIKRKDPETNESVADFIAAMMKLK